MTLRSVLTSLAIIIILIFVWLATYSFFHRPLVHHISPDLQVIGIINNEGHSISNEEVLNGEDGVLVVDHVGTLYQQIIQKIPQARLLNQEEVFNLNNLHLFDQNSDGLITAQDPIFEHLLVIRFYHNGEQNEIKSLAAAGIKSIYIKTTPTGDHEVLMSDGSTRTLYSENKLEKSEGNPDKEQPK
jgi:hypothetical protein